MRLRRRVLALPAIVVLLISCSTLFSRRPTTPNGLAAVTAQARLGSNSTAAPALPITGATGTPAGTHVSVTSATNCRSGPGASYDLVFLVYPGASFQVVGKYTPDNYWIINNPAGGTCWLWGQSAVVSGDTAGLPEYPAPQATRAPMPTATLAPTATSTSTPASAIVTLPVVTPVPPVLPSAPTTLKQSRTCTAGFKGTTPIWIEDITLTWHDSAYESGYRIYENGSAISSIPQNSNSYQIELRYDQGTGSTTSDSFGVEAYNNGGASSRPSVDVPRCP